MAAGRRLTSSAALADVAVAAYDRRARFDDPEPARREGPARIPIRTLAIAGGAAGPAPQERIAELALRIPDCRLVTTEAGRLVHSARPAEFVAAVASFLEP